MAHLGTYVLTRAEGEVSIRHGPSGQTWPRRLTGAGAFLGMLGPVCKGVRIKAVGDDAETRGRERNVSSWSPSRCRFSARLSEQGEGCRHILIIDGFVRCE